MSSAWHDLSVDLVLAENAHHVSIQGSLGFTKSAETWAPQQGLRTPCSASQAPIGS